MLEKETTEIPPKVAIKEPVDSVSILKQEQEDQLWKNLKLSLGAHALFVIIAIVSGLVFEKPPIKFTPSIRVDLVALPDIAKKDLQNQAPSPLEELSKRLDNVGKKQPQEQVETPPADTLALKKRELKKVPPKDGKKDNLKSAIDRIKALTEIESEVKQTSASAKSKTVAKGNVLSKGNSLTGPQSNDTNAYIGSLQGRLRDNWNLPVWLSKQNLDAKVVIFLDKAGYVSNTVFSKGSGDKQFDEYVLKTIRMAQPFGPPPEEIVDGGITLGFPL